MTDIQKYEGRPSTSDGRSATEIRTYDFLDGQGVSYTTITHPAAYTMEDCEAVEKEMGAMIPKNLFLCNRQQTQFYLLVLPGNKVFKTKYLSSQLGCARLSFANEQQMVSLLGIHPGAVSPMGLINDTKKQVLLVIDKDLLTANALGFHPCVNTATIRLKMSDVIEKVALATGHDYRVVELMAESKNSEL